ncbi:hypothetical protein A2U01_0023811, partial [Trifolium medium]|nr:hypothetical protein [Trifolium medium]
MVAVFNGEDGLKLVEVMEMICWCYLWVEETDEWKMVMISPLFMRWWCDDFGLIGVR